MDDIDQIFNSWSNFLDNDEGEEEAPKASNNVEEEEDFFAERHRGKLTPKEACNLM